ncbi:MAG: hypothetical protein EA392_10475 [Cryomorphaceae bacterium]|nr:MAG: hypothetical protein EA392_10475 [Cryomorphaceae bacterium]
MKTTFSLVILIGLTIVSFGQIQSTDQPIEIRNYTLCTIRFIVHCSSNGDCDPMGTTALAEQSIGPNDSTSLNQCTGHFAFIKFSFDLWATSHVIGFDTNLPNICAGLEDCDNYDMPYEYHVGDIDEDCIGEDGEIRANRGESGCVIWFKP